MVKDSHKTIQETFNSLDTTKQELSPCTNVCLFSPLLVKVEVTTDTQTHGLG